MKIWKRPWSTRSDHYEIVLEIGEKFFYINAEGEIMNFTSDPEGLSLFLIEEDLENLWLPDREWVLRNLI